MRTTTTFPASHRSLHAQSLEIVCLRPARWLKSLDALSQNLAFACESVKDTGVIDTAIDSAANCPREGRVDFLAGNLNLKGVTEIKHFSTFFIRHFMIDRSEEAWSLPVE